MMILMAVVNMFYTAHYWVLGHLECVSGVGVAVLSGQIFESYHHLFDVVWVVLCSHVIEIKASHVEMHFRENTFVNSSLRSQCYQAV